MLQKVNYARDLGRNLSNLLTIQLMKLSRYCKVLTEAVKDKEKANDVLQ